LGMIVLLGGGLSACTESGGLRMPAAEPTIYPPAVFDHRLESSHVAIYWNCERPEPGVVRVRLRVEKPGALRFARSVGIEIERERGDAG